jgi:small subunit ribosomal protein S17
MVNKKTKVRNIGFNTKPPEDTCTDINCPFHGNLSVRGQVITGVVSSVKMQNSLLVKKEFTHLVPKYERYEKRTSIYSAHCPPCIKVNVGDNVRIAECRPISKTISFVTIEKI